MRVGFKNAQPENNKKRHPNKKILLEMQCSKLLLLSFVKP